MTMAKATEITATVELKGDNFPHAWFFNRFRLDKIGSSPLVTMALVSESGTILAVNSVVIGISDLKHVKERSLKYFEDMGDQGSPDPYILGAAPPPERVYPVNFLNLAMVDGTAEFCFFRFSLHTFLTLGRSSGGQNIACYPVVLFRCDIAVQAALLKVLLAAV